MLILVIGVPQKFNSPRGNMFFEIARFIDIMHPRAILLENVRNMLNHDNGRTFGIIYNTLVSLGYYIKYAVIDATDVNIPQYRSRLFITAFREAHDYSRFSFPEPIPLTASINDIIDRRIKHDDIYYYNEINIYYKELNSKIADKTGIYRIDDSGVATRNWVLCPTLKANMGTFHDRVPIIRDDYGIRKLTPMECLALQGFPHDFKFKGISLNEAYKQCGNTVCVPILKGIAERMAETMNNVKYKV